jgi:two-component sensor histidine kinase
MSEPSERPKICTEATGPALVLAELSHRVGNELTAALSALRMVQRSLKDVVEPTGFLDQAVSRLEQFGELHHILDRTRAHGSLSGRLEALCRAISVAKAGPRGIRIAVSADEIAVDDEIAWTACVIVSELLTNAIKHAFLDEDDGLVIVELRDERGMIALTVIDNGAGIDAARQGFSDCPPQAPGAGWRIVTELAERLGGAVSRCSLSTGTTVMVALPTRVPLL